jgi:hypothetical protein
VSHYISYFADTVKELRILADEYFLDEFDTYKMLEKAADELEDLRELEEDSYILEVSDALDLMLEYDEHQKMAIIETMNKRLEQPLPSPERVLKKSIYYYSHSVSELRDFCKDLYLPSSGNKDELVYLLVKKWLSELMD